MWNLADFFENIVRSRKKAKPARRRAVLGRTYVTNYTMIQQRTWKVRNWDRFGCILQSTPQLMPFGLADFVRQGINSKNDIRFVNIRKRAWVQKAKDALCNRTYPEQAWPCKEAVSGGRMLLCREREKDEAVSRNDRDIVFWSYGKEGGYCDAEGILYHEIWRRHRV